MVRWHFRNSLCHDNCLLVTLIYISTNENPFKVLDTTNIKCKLFTPLNFWTGSSFVMIIKRDWTFGTWLMLCIGFCSKVLPCRTGIFLKAAQFKNIWLTKSKNLSNGHFLAFLNFDDVKSHRQSRNDFRNCRGTSGRRGPQMGEHLRWMDNLSQWEWSIFICFYCGPPP